jgi:hypothetical protein
MYAERMTFTLCLGDMASYEERVVDALAVGSDEGRGQLR